MRPEVRHSLAEALSAAIEVTEFGATFETDRIVGLAVERLLMIIGEALIRVRGLDPGLFEGIPDAKLFVGMRNVIAHDYDRLDPKRIRSAIESELPALIDDLQNRLNQG